MSEKATMAVSENSGVSGDTPDGVVVPTCVSPGCERPVGSYGRGLCNVCRRRYAREIARKETTWPILEKAGKCLPSKVSTRPNQIRKALEAKKAAERSGEVETPAHKKELAKIEFRYEVLLKIADMLMAKKGLTSIAAYLESEGILTAKDRPPRLAMAARWKRKAQHMMVRESGFPIAVHVAYLRRKLTKIIENEIGESTANRLNAIKEYRSLFVPKQVHFEGIKTERKEVTVNIVREKYGNIFKQICGPTGADPAPLVEAGPDEGASVDRGYGGEEPVPAGTESHGEAVVLDGEASSVLGL